MDKMFSLLSLAENNIPDVGDTNMLFLVIGAAAALGLIIFVFLSRKKR